MSRQSEQMMEEDMERDGSEPLRVPSRRVPKGENKMITDMMAQHPIGYSNSRGRVTSDGIFTPWGWPE